MRAWCAGPGSVTARVAKVCTREEATGWAEQFDSDDQGDEVARGISLRCALMSRRG